MFKFRPVLMAEEGLDTSSFFAGQDIVDESALPDAGPELLDEAPETGAVDQLPDDADEADPAKTDQAAQGRKQFVPLGALQEERARRQAEQEQNRILQERMNQFLQLQVQAQQQQQQQQQQAQQPQAPEIPAFVDDPEGHVKGLVEQFNRVIEQQNQTIQQLTGNSHATAQQQALAHEVNAAEATFRQAEPNYDAALQHYNAVKVAEYMAFGATEQQARQQLARDYQGVAINAKQNGKNPAEVMFGIAKALGFQAAPPQQQAPQGQLPKAAPTSLSNLPAAGKAPDEKGPMSAKQVAQMTNEEFDAFFKEMERGSVQRPAF